MPWDRNLREALHPGRRRSPGKEFLGGRVLALCLAAGGKSAIRELSGCPHWESASGVTACGKSAIRESSGCAHWELASGFTAGSVSSVL